MLRTVERPRIIGKHRSAPIPTYYPHDLPCLDDFTIETIERNLQTVDFRTPVLRVETLSLLNVETGQHDRAQVLIGLEFHQDIPPLLPPACGYCS